MVACEQWQEKAPLGAYIYKVAINYLLGQRRRKWYHSETPFCEFTDGNDADVSEVVERYAPDPQAIYTDCEINEAMLQFIRNRIAEKSDWKVHAKHYGKYPAQANRAIRMLDTFAQSAADNTGIGVDEYDSRDYFQRKYRGYRNECAEVVNHLCEQQLVGKRTVSDCMHALREETRHALAERREHPDYYIEFQTESDETLTVLREQDARAMQ